MVADGSKELLKKFPAALYGEQKRHGRMSKGAARSGLAM